MESKIPLYVQVSNDIRFKINNGQWLEGDQIPTEIELCEKYSVSRITIRKAIDILVDEGLLTKKRALGTFVNEQTNFKKYTYVNSFFEEMRELGREAYTLEAKVKVLKADKKISNALNIPFDSPVLNLKRLFGTENKPFAFFNTYITYNQEFSLSDSDYYGSFYQYLSNFGIVVNSFQEYVEAVSPPSYLISVLSIDKNEPLLKRVRFSKQSDNDFAEYSECFYIGDEYRYYINMR